MTDDNRYSGSLFKMLKSTVGFPKYFNDFDHTKEWMTDFVNWYNIGPPHSSLNGGVINLFYGKKHELFFDLSRETRASLKYT